MNSVGKSTIFAFPTNVRSCLDSGIIDESRYEKVELHTAQKFVAYLLFLLKNSYIRISFIRGELS